jgi:hypothetical protein
MRNALIDGPRKNGAAANTCNTCTGREQAAVALFQEAARHLRKPPRPHGCTSAQTQLITRANPARKGQTPGEEGRGERVSRRVGLTMWPPR